MTYYCKIARVLYKSYFVRNQPPPPYPGQQSVVSFFFHSSVRHSLAAGRDLNKNSIVGARRVSAYLSDRRRHQCHMCAPNVRDTVNLTRLLGRRPRARVRFGFAHVFTEWLDFTTIVIFPVGFRRKFQTPLKYRHCSQTRTVCLSGRCTTPFPVRFSFRNGFTNISRQFQPTRVARGGICTFIPAPD